MPKLDNNLWIEGGYYVDFDQLNQFRILGPNNHLYCGLIDIPRHRIAIDKVEATADQKCVVTGRFLSKSINLYYPTMGDMRTMRGLVVDQQTGTLKSFLELRRTEHSESVPMWIHKSIGSEGKAIVFRRSYGEKWYGITFTFAKNVSMHTLERPFGGFRLEVKTKTQIPFTITATTNDFPEVTYHCSVLPAEAINWKVFGKEAKTIRKFWDRSKVEADHLITWGKTSGDRFGTVFPRDWMESVLLGAGDIPSETIDAMIYRCLANVDSHGRMWHEDAVGEFRYKHQLSGRDIFDRKMIDIEPLTLLALRYASPYFWTNKEAIKKIRLVANFVASRARKKLFIAFKLKPKKYQTKEEPYYLVGNWRDSTWAYKKIHPHIAPFDVNAVLYPQALALMQALYQKLDLNIPDLKKMLQRWEKKLGDFAFQNPDKLTAFALAVYGFPSNVPATSTKTKHQLLKVNHLDECFLYALAWGTETELISFCKRLLSKNYFYTGSGPMLIAANNDLGYTTQEYHGLVIWTQQVGFTVMGLVKHYEHKKTDWKTSTIQLLRETSLKICKDMIKTFDKLGSIPELHYDDHDMPRLFTDQQAVGERMSKVQLWSAIGARRIFREYYKLLK
ncbi:MAG: hypothetical protein WCT08_05045 [Patescibacteria group bacterium]|jgi:hypothetical protein